MLARAHGLGFGDADARELVDHFLGAELRGASGHGVERLRWISAFADLQPAAEPRLVERDGGIARWDAGGALGYLALSRALERELDDPPAGARLVVVRHGFPTGRLGHYAERVAEAGLCCLVTATSTARISHPGGGPPLLGTNPLCLAVPGEHGPALVDVSMGRITYGTVLKAAATASPLPEGAAVGAAGGPATNPADVTSGVGRTAPVRRRPGVQGVRARPHRGAPLPGPRRHRRLLGRRAGRPAAGAARRGDPGRAWRPAVPRRRERRAPAAGARGGHARPAG